MLRQSEIAQNIRGLGSSKIVQTLVFFQIRVSKGKDVKKIIIILLLMTILSGHTQTHTHNEDKRLIQRECAGLDTFLK